MFVIICFVIAGLLFVLYAFMSNKDEPKVTKSARAIEPTVESQAIARRDDGQDDSLESIRHRLIKRLANAPKVDTTPVRREDVSIARLTEFYSPSKGRFSSWWQGGKAEARAKLLTQLNQEQLLVIEQGAILEREVQAREKNEVEFKMFIAQNIQVLNRLMLEQARINQAIKRGRTPETDDFLTREEGHSRIRIDEAQRLSDIKVVEHQRVKETDLETRWKEILQDSNAADLALIGDHLVIKKLRDELAQARRERYAIKNGNDPKPLKRELLADYDKFIKRLEAKIDERETGHLLSENREAARKLPQAQANGRADYPPETDEDSI
jgi:hypothetical protein